MMKVWHPDSLEIEDTHTWETWKKEASEFPWTYSQTEICFILEGEAEVTDSEGNSIFFGKGAMVSFQKGLNCTWNIRQDIKKKYIFK